MAQYIDKSALIEEIEKILLTHTKHYDELAKCEVWITAKEIEHRTQGLKEALSIINTLEVKEVQEEPVSEDLEEEIQKTIHNHFFDLDGIAIVGTSVYATVDDMVYIAKHFANWQKEQMMAKAIRGRVSVNVKSNYHSLIYGCWDMDNALKNYNEGDKVKVIVIKEE